jgi:hypothetical protein
MQHRRLLHLPLSLALAFLAVPSLASAEDPNQPERVVMKLDKFLEIYERLRERDRELESPHPFALSSANYRGEVVVEEGVPRTVFFDARLQIDVLAKKGWVRVPLLPASVALESAKIAGKEASVVLEGGWYVLVTDRRGPLALDLQFAAAIESVDGRNRVEFPLAPSGATEVTLAVPTDQDQEFSVANAKRISEKVTPGKAGASRREVTASLPATGSMSISWQRQVTQTAAQEAQVHAEVQSLVGIGEGLVRVTSTVNHTILFAGKDTLRFRTPSDFTLVDVKGNGIRDWKRSPDGTVEVLLNFSAEGAYALTLVLEKVIESKTSKLDTPIVAALDVARAKGFVGVESQGTLEISASGVKDATPLDVRALPAAILGNTEQPVLLGYKYLGSSPTIPLTLAEHEDLDVLVTLVDQIQARTMWTREGRRLTAVRYQVRNNRRQFLRLALPKGATLWSASVADRATQPGRDASGMVLIPLVRSQVAGGALAAFDVEVVYVEDGTPTPERGAGHFEAELPRADVPATYVGWMVYMPDEVKPKKRSFDGTLERVRYLTNPIPFQDAHVVDTVAPQMQVQEQMAVQVESGALGQGAAPVEVSLPLQGVPVNLEKVIALDEPLRVEFDYKVKAAKRF